MESYAFLERSHLNRWCILPQRLTMLLENYFLLLFPRKKYNLLMKLEITEVFLSKN